MKNILHALHTTSPSNHDVLACYRVFNTYVEVSLYLDADLMQETSMTLQAARADYKERLTNGWSKKAPGVHASDAAK